MADTVGGADQPTSQLVRVPNTRCEGRSRIHFEGGSVRRAPPPRAAPAPSGRAWETLRRLDVADRLTIGGADTPFATSGPR